MKDIKIRDNQRSIVLKVTNFFLRKKKINLNKLINKAKKKARYDGSDCENFLEAAKILVKDINDSSELSAFGSYFAEQMLEKSLTSLFDIQKETKVQKVILDKAPIFILGLPRTGSTFLFNILSKDPNFRSLNLWESQRFSKEVSDKSKMIKGKMQLISSHWYAPNIKAIHEVRFEGPSECTQILTNSMKNISFGCYFHLPNYCKWLANQSQIDTYELHKKQLYLLGKSEQWLLKAPPHLMTYKDLMAVYPDAKIIQLHRDPAEVIGSASSLISATRNMFTSKPILKITGQEMAKCLKWGSEKTLKEREEITSTNLIDVTYKDLVAAPMATLETIYSALNLDWSEDLEKTFEIERKITRKNKFGKHTYDLKDYGLSQEEIRKENIDYIKRFNL